jgi:hypothetical protein
VPKPRLSVSVKQSALKIACSVLMPYYSVAQWTIKIIRRTRRTHITEGEKNMAYILIIISSLTPSIWSAEFATKERCESAGFTIRQQLVAHGASQARFVCLEK